MGKLREIQSLAPKALRVLSYAIWVGCIGLIVASPGRWYQFLVLCALGGALRALCPIITPNPADKNSRLLRARSVWVRPLGVQGVILDYILSNDLYFVWHPTSGLSEDGLYREDAIEPLDKPFMFHGREWDSGSKALGTEDY